MKVKSESEVVQSCLTLCDPMDCGPPGSYIHGIFQARVLEWGAIGEGQLKAQAQRYCPLTCLSDVSAELLFPSESKWGGGE